MYFDSSGMLLNLQALNFFCDAIPDIKIHKNLVNKYFCKQFM